MTRQVNVGGNSTPKSPEPMVTKI